MLEKEKTYQVTMTIEELDTLQDALNMYCQFLMDLPLNNSQVMYVYRHAACSIAKSIANKFGRGLISLADVNW